MTTPPGDPTPFRVGVVLGGFDAEGGFNRPDQPANNWYWWEIEGRARPSTGQLWGNWELEVARAAAVGCDAIRVCVEWPRCEPLDGQIDRRAVAAYCRLLDCCHEHGLQPAVTLHRFAHPAWMGVDFWLRPDAPERFRHWVETAVDHFAGRTHHWVTIDQLNMSAIWSYLSGRYPPGRRLDLAATIRSLDHLLAGHVLAYEAIKERQPQAVVAMGTRALPVYELDRVLVDVVLGRAAGVGRHDLGDWLAQRRRNYPPDVEGAGGPGERGPGRTALAWAVRQWAASAIPLDQALARAVAAVYDGGWRQPLDVLQVGGEDDDLSTVLPVPLPAVGTDGCSRLVAACRMNRDVELPLWVLSDGPAPTGGFGRNVADVERAHAEGARVTAFFQRLAPLRSDRAGDARARAQVLPGRRRAGVSPS
ncbi:MAG: family 1 glycosylhydrolase [Acidimicrobiales bacterium]